MYESPLGRTAVSNPSNLCALSPGQSSTTVAGGIRALGSDKYRGPQSEAVKKRATVALCAQTMTQVSTYVPPQSNNRMTANNPMATNPSTSAGAR